MFHYVAGSDFVPIVELELVIPASTENQLTCANVIVVDDEISENTESFIVEISSANDRVLVENFTLIPISDDDGK